MGKSGGNFNKQLANKIKAKGLQKLRWFCQVCEKQCRDENGFKCHINSESHQRAMVAFSHNAGQMLSQYSREFEGAFLGIAKRRARNQFIAANLIYNELISDRFHTHMNSTVWVTLGNFIGHLSKTGKCIVEERPKGLFIQYVEKDPELVRRQEAMLKTRKHELDEEARNMEFIKGLVAKAHATETEPTAPEPETHALDLEALDKDAFSFSLKPAAKRAFGFGPSSAAPLKSEAALPAAASGSSPAAPLEKPADGHDEGADDGEGEPNGEEEEEEEGEGEGEDGGMYIDEFGRLRSLADDVAEEEAPSEPQQQTDGAEKSEATPAPPASAVTETTAPAHAALAPVAAPLAQVQKTPEASTKFSLAPAPTREPESKAMGKDAKPPVASEPKRKLTAIEEIMLAEEQKKEKMKRRDYWLVEGIVVKVINKQLADGKYYKRKGVVEQVIDRYVGLVAMLDADVKGHKLKLDQGQLETVIPAIGGKMLVVNGAYRGEQVTLVSVDVDNFCVQVKIDHGIHHGRVLDRVAYEDVCKLNV